VRLPTVLRVLSVPILLTAIWYAHSPQAFAACAPLPTAKGTATFSVAIPASGTYRFWVHEYSPSANVNGVYAQVDTYCQTTVGDSATIPVGQFSWIDYQNANAASKMDLTLNAGTRTVTLAGLDQGVGIDKVMFVSDLSCVPTGQGDNCGSTTTPSSPPPAPSGGTPAAIVPSSSGTPAQPNGTPVSGIISLPQNSTAHGAKQTYYIDGKPIAGSKLDTTILSDGTHTLTLVQRNPDGTTKVLTQKLIVRNHPSTWQRVRKILALPAVWGPIVVVAMLALGGLGAWYFARSWSERLLIRLKILKASKGAAAMPGAIVYQVNTGTLRGHHSRLIAFIVGFGIVGAVIISYAFAATTTVSYVLSNATVANGATVVTNGAAISGKMVQFAAPVAAPAPSPGPSPSPSPTPSPGGGTQTLGCIPTPHLCGFPDATNTGMSNPNLPRVNGTDCTKISATAITVISGDCVIKTAGTYSNLDISGALDIEADHVTVSNARIRGEGGDGGCLCGSYDMLVDAELGGGANGTTYTGVGSGLYSGGNQSTHNVIQRVNIHHTDDGFRLDGGTIVEDSYVHDLSSGLNGSHSDDSQSCEGTYFSFIHNTFLGGNNDPIFLQGGDCGSNDAFFLDHVLVDHNLLTSLHEPDNISGYGISIGRGRNITITNNHFDRGWQVASIGIYLSNTLVQDQTTLTKTTASNWNSLGNIYDDNGDGVLFPGN
jgi:hypothetical protein